MQPNFTWRPEPAMGPENYKTYAIDAPRSTHQRRARCEEVDCANHERGWLTLVDERTELGARQAGYIRTLSGRQFRETRENDPMTEFWFEPGQQCFAEHWTSLEREPQFLVLGGDWRGNPRGEAPRVHRTFDDWANDFGEHQDALKRAQS